MPHEFRMPDIGEGLTEGEIVAWLVHEGDSVVVDQPIVEVETAKTTVEIPAPRAGTIARLVGKPGDTVIVGDVLFVVDAGGEAVGTTRPEGDVSDAPRTDPSEPGSDLASLSTPSVGAAAGAQGTRAMPIVRNLARDLGVDLSNLTGSGPNGAITRADVENAEGQATGRVSSGSAMNVVPLTGVRKAIAAHMAESWTTIPHVTVQAEVRAEALVAARHRSGDRTLPVEALVATVVMPLLSTFPEFNAVIRDDGIAYRDGVNLGFAVDTEAGLMVVVVRDAHAKSLAEIATDFERLATAAIGGTAKPDELTGQTFTISNIGALGGGHGTPIIPVGTSAIVSIGRAIPQPVVEDGALAVGLVAPLDLSYDHRLIDGALGQRFLSALVTALETL